MSQLNEFVMPTARPLPVILLADVSGSMAANGKIQALNDAVAEMIATFAEEDDSRAEIHVAVITFGLDGARLYKPLQPAGEGDLGAHGGRRPDADGRGVWARSTDDREQSDHSRAGLSPHPHPGFGRRSHRRLEPSPRGVARV